MMRRLVLMLAVCGLTGCGGSAVLPGAAHVAVLHGTGLPASIGGLKTAASDVSQAVLKSTDPHYVDGVALVTLSTPATPSQLVGTLEVAHYATGTAIADPAVRSALVSQLGSLQPYTLDIEGTPVEVTFSKSTVIAAWFGRSRMYILSLRSDFTGAKALLRAATAVAS